MRFYLFALALVASTASFAGNGACKESYLPPINSADSFQAFRAKLFTAGFFPVLAPHPENVPTEVIQLGFLEISSCQNTHAFKGCYSNWITRLGEKIVIALPADGRQPFLADCPRSMRSDYAYPPATESL